MSNEKEVPGKKDISMALCEEHRAFLSVRTAAREAAFFVPYLKPGMRLLDCGSGMAMLTTSLAEIVAPGEVIGIDLEPSRVEAAWGGQSGKASPMSALKPGTCTPFPSRMLPSMLSFLYGIRACQRSPAGDA